MGISASFRPLTGNPLVNKRSSCLDKPWYTGGFRPLTGNPLVNYRIGNDAKAVSQYDMFPSPYGESIG